MTVKRKILCIICTLFQTAALVFGFLPRIFKLSQYVLSPFTGEFEYDKPVALFNIFFNPAKFQLSAVHEPMPDKGLWTVFALLFLCLSAVSVILLVLGMIKKRISKIAVLTSFCAFAFVLLTAAFVAFFSFESLTFQYNGKLQYGYVALLCFQLIGAVLSCFAVKKEKVKKSISPDNKARETSTPEIKTQAEACKAQGEIAREQACESVEETAEE